MSRDYVHWTSSSPTTTTAVMEEQANRPHRKTKVKKKHTGDRNPKAFGYANPGRLAKQAVRSHDVSVPHS